MMSRTTRWTMMIIEVEAPPFVDAGRMKEELARTGQEIGVVISTRPKDDVRS